MIAVTSGSDLHLSAEAGAELVKLIKRLVEAERPDGGKQDVVGAAVELLSIFMSTLLISLAAVCVKIRICGTHAACMAGAMYSPRGHMGYPGGQRRHGGET